MSKDFDALTYEERIQWASEKIVSGLINNGTKGMRDAIEAVIPRFLDQGYRIGKADGRQAGYTTGFNNGRRAQADFMAPLVHALVLWKQDVIATELIDEERDREIEEALLDAFHTYLPLHEQVIEKYP
jgi:hypothetical protein